MNIWTTITILGAIAIAGYYITAAYIITTTGTTNGIRDLAQGAAEILTALFTTADDN